MQILGKGKSQLVTITISYSYSVAEIENRKSLEKAYHCYEKNMENEMHKIPLEVEHLKKIHCNSLELAQQILSENVMGNEKQVYYKELEVNCI